MRVLITRPAADARILAAALAARGIDSLVAPLIEPRVLPVPADLEARLAAAQAVLVTSPNGARALGAATPRRDLRLLAVGDATAAALEALGFAPAASADGDADDLAALAGARLDPARGPLLHARGLHATIRLDGLLEARGFALDRAVLYEMVAARELEPALAVALGEQALGAALFFSPRTARIFVSLVAAAGLAGSCRSIAMVGLSEAVVAAAADLPWRETRAAERPTQAALLSALDGLAFRA